VVLRITLIERPYLFERILLIIIMIRTTTPTPTPTNYAQKIPAQVYKGRNKALCHRQE
jgi:hypothetical protein